MVLWLAGHTPRSRLIDLWCADLVPSGLARNVLTKLPTWSLPVWLETRSNEVADLVPSGLAVKSTRHVVLSFFFSAADANQRLQLGLA